MTQKFQSNTKVTREYLDAGPADNNKPSAEWLEAQSDYLAREYKGLLVAFIDGRDVDRDTNKKRLVSRVYRQHKELPYLLQIKRGQKDV